MSDDNNNIFDIFTGTELAIISVTILIGIALLQTNGFSNQNKIIIMMAGLSLLAALAGVRWHNGK